MTVLLTGGTGKTSRRLASLLSTTAHIPLLGSRSLAQTSSHASVHFDWHSPSTHPNPFAHPAAQARPISAVYLVAPPVLEPFEPMKEFIDFARRRGVNRFVLLSASSLEAGGPLMGRVHALLEGLESEGVEWAVLQPTWFIFLPSDAVEMEPALQRAPGCHDQASQNFSEAQHAPTIRDEGRIYSAAGAGRIPFVSADDVAAVALRALTDRAPHNAAYLVLGPELLSYDDVARVLFSALGRRVEHVRLSADELVARLVGGGVPEEYARLLARLDGAVEEGAEERVNGVVEQVTGKRPVGFGEFVQR